MVIDYENGIIQIDYPNIYSHVNYLLDYVRPVGMIINLRAVVPADIRREAMLVYATIQNDTKPYDPNVQTAFSKSFINFSAFADEKWLEQFTDSEESDVELNFNE